MSGSSWRVLGYLLIFGLVFGLVASLLTFVLTVIVNRQSLYRDGHGGDRSCAHGVVNFGGVLIGALLMPFPAIGMTLLYIDLRFRKGEPVPRGQGVVGRRARYPRATRLGQSPKSSLSQASSGVCGAASAPPPPSGVMGGGSGAADSSENAISPGAPFRGRAPEEPGTSRSGSVELATAGIELC